MAISNTTNFSRKDNQRGSYKLLSNVSPLEIHIHYSQGNPIALVGAKEGGEQGACVKLDAGIEIKPDGQRSRLTGPVAIVVALDIARGDPRARLAFLDNTDTLYLIKPGRLEAEAGSKQE